MRTRQSPHVVVLAAAMLVALSACVASPGDAASAMKGHWQLVSGSDSTGPLELAGQDVTLDILDSKISGTAACNYYGGSLTGARGSILISSLAQTAMACADASKMELESRYLTALAAVQKARTTPTELTLGGPGIVLVFHRASK
jgi:heat shock protein HslJ